MKTPIRPLKHSINLPPVRFAFRLIVFTLACFALLPKVQGQISPPPNGCIPNFTTAAGCNALNLLSSGAGNTGLGWYALFSDSTGGFNTAVGGGALTLNNGDSNTAVGAAALLLNTSGTENTAVGTAALVNNDTGSNNSAFGTSALFSNTTGNENTTNGYEALFNNTTGNENTAIGDSALFNNTTGGDNTAIGYHALFDNAGDLNTATGWQALSSNTTGAANTADGLSALLNNTTGNFNTAIGETALQNNSTADDNTATGHNALAANTTGFANTAIGSHALENNTTGNLCVAVGYSALQNCTGTSNTAIGNHAGSLLTTGSGNIDIDSEGLGDEDNTIRIGNIQTRTFIQGISGVPVTGTVVVVADSGQLGVVPSSQRFKDQIKPMDKASEAVLALKPVTFRYKKELDPQRDPQFGLVAEEVAKVNPDLVARDAKGKVYTVRYEAVNTMLLNEFLKEHCKVERLEATVANLVTTVKEQAAQIQKVSAQLELTKPAPQTVLNNQ